MNIPNNTQLYFRRASLYSNSTLNKDKLKVRILPDMVGLDKKELPFYGMFNSTELIHGLAEEDTYDYQKSTKLWVLCTSDYKSGFIFSEDNSDNDISSNKSSISWPFKSFYTHVSRMGLNTNSFNYKELKVIYTNTPYYNMFSVSGVTEKKSIKTAGMIDVTNTRTGERWIMLSSGTCIAIMQDGLHFRVGSPSLDGRSTIDITPNEIYIKSKNIVLDAEHTSLGRHGMNVAGFQGCIPVAVDGQSIVPLYDVTI